YRSASSRDTNRVYAQRPPLRACTGSESCGFGKAGEGDSGVDQDGGVIILARHPITEAKELVYGDCEGRDCHAAKGFVYAAIEKAGKRYHIIATHAQFGWQPEQSAAKRKQFGQIREFARRTSGIPESEPIIVGGDFNMLRHEFGELENAALLGAIAPKFLGHPYTRETRNDWVEHGNGYVDYIFALRASEAPTYSSNCPLVFRTRYDFADTTLFSTVRGEDLCDLSDHFAVWGYFDFRDPPLAAAPACPLPIFPE
ncbi:MAG: endonuclease/exonuclease/phosphatase family protein, partial [Alphaproteobacteria bacterium]